MPKANPAHAPGRVSEAAVRGATGRGWQEWLRALDQAGAAAWSHREMVAWLQREHPGVSSWWRQSITVEYEKARGMRVVGQTADAGFQVGVQRSVAAAPAEVWALVAARPELWLGEGAAVDLRSGARYEVPGVKGDAGARGEVRVVKPLDRLRMTWQPAEWAAPATLQLTLTQSGAGKTRIGVHLEKLPDAEAREAMRTHWRAVLERIVAALQ